MNRRTFLTTAVALAASLGGVGPVLAQLSPARPIRLIVGTPAGGAVDPYARLVAEHMARTLHRVIIVENNYSGQFARYLRSETSYVPNGYIRKYDGEPFMPHHLVEAVMEQLAGKSKLSVPAHEIMV